MIDIVVDSTFYLIDFYTETSTVQQQWYSAVLEVAYQGFVHNDLSDFFESLSWLLEFCGTKWNWIIKLTKFSWNMLSIAYYVRLVVFVLLKDSI